MEFTTNNSISIKLGPAHSPWSNGCNERNHYSADKIVDKIMESDKKVKLEEAVSMAGWTHNTNSNRSGFSPMQLVTGKSVIIPGITYSNPVNHGETNSEIVQRIMERHRLLMKEYTEAEFSHKIAEITGQRRQKY